MGCTKRSARWAWLLAVALGLPAVGQEVREVRAITIAPGVPMPAGSVVVDVNGKLPPEMFKQIVANLPDPAGPDLKLLQNKEVQGDLGLSADELAGVPLVLETLKEDEAKFRKDLEKAEGFQSKEFGATMKRRQDAAAEALKGLLGDKGKRLKELRRQAQGIMKSLADPEVAPHVQANPEWFQDISAKTQGIMSKAFTPGEPPSPEKLQQAMADMAKAMDDELLKKLSPAQLGKWKELTGKPAAFKLPSLDEVPKMSATGFAPLTAPPATKAKEEKK